MSEKIKELVIKYISTFNLERLINIANYESGMCHSCKHHSWLEPTYKHAFWGCKVSTIKFEERYNCRGKKFEPKTSFLDYLKKEIKRFT